MPTSITTALNSPGDRHLDRILREVAAGVPGRAPEIRLTAAADFACVLDGVAA